MPKKIAEIQMRDPFVLPVAAEALYYLFGTTDEDCWRAPGRGFDCYSGSDLETWDGPFPAFRPPEGFWGKKNFWAPEAHAYKGKYFLFASFIAEGLRRGTQVLASEAPRGPYLPHSEGPLTPREWECLDGTLFIDEEGSPWMVFCHEWVQARDGEVCAIRLSGDLRAAVGDPVLLFRGSEAPWTRPHRRKDRSVDPAARVTDGPFLHRTAAGQLFLLWSSFSDTGYALGLARSGSGALSGPWIQGKAPLVDADAGHGMIFRTFDGGLCLAVHAPNDSPNERPRFLPVVETDAGLALAKARPNAGARP